MREFAEEALGGGVIWAPSAWPNRAVIARTAPHWRIAEEDWRPVAPDLNVSPDALERARPVVGMFRVAQSRPWPKDEDDWAARLIDDPYVAYRLRGAPVILAKMAPSSAPLENWPTVEPLQAYLSRIDMLANADDVWDDPCPVEALIALRAGVIPYLPPDFRGVFGASAFYGPRKDLPITAAGLQGDRSIRDGMRTAAQDALAEYFSAEKFVARVRDMIGAPSRSSIAPGRAGLPKARVIMFSTNGVGMGHLTRQLAVARRLPAKIEPVFLSHSQAVGVVRKYGFIAEHTPYHAAYGEAKKHWNQSLAALLDSVIDFYDPAAVLFDGNVPFKALMTTFAKHPGVARLWMRRAMWGKGRDLEALERSAKFDIVMEPGELADSYDDGPTVALRSETRVLSPVRLLDSAEQPDRATACAELRLDPYALNVYVALGSGNNFSMAPLLREALDELRRVDQCQVCVARWMISDQADEWPADVSVLKGYPFSRWLNAFDFAIAAAGYNSFAEHMAAALPTIWTPNEHALMDSQLGRAEYAARREFGLTVRTGQEPYMKNAVQRMLNDAERGRFRTKLQTQDSPNGASTAADIVADLCFAAIAR